MINRAAGSEQVREGVRGIEIRRPGGHAIYGPYERRAPGSYSVRFPITALAPAAGDPVVAPAAGDPIVAYVDVVADAGSRTIAADYVLASELRSGGPVALDFDLAREETLEYRVQPTAAVPLFVADAASVEARSGGLRRARLTEAGMRGVATVAAERGVLLEDLLGYVRPPGGDDAGALEAIRTAFRPLRPSRVLGSPKRRLGRSNDGAYVCVDDFRGIDTVLSFGIERNVTFDLAAARRGATIYQFDHTVEAPRPGDRRMVFERKRIAAHPAPGAETLPALIRRHDRGRREPNILLKIDIECWEWPVLDAVEPRELGRLRQITGEFHCFQWLGVPPWRERAVRVLGTLADQFALVHVHANNFAGTSTFEGIPFPNVLEMTLVNRRCYALEPSGETFPTRLDRPCDRTSPELELGTFAF